MDDSRFFFSNSLNPYFESKLSRAASFSELSSKTNKISKEEKKLENGGNLVKQYSCEDISDHKSKTRDLKPSKQFKYEDEKRNTWRSNTDLNESFLSEQPQFDPEGVFKVPRKPGSAKKDFNAVAKQIIAPPKLVFPDEGSRQLVSHNNGINNNQLITVKNYEVNEPLHKTKPYPALPSRRKAMIRNTNTVINSDSMTSNHVKTESSQRESRKTLKSNSKSIKNDCLVIKQEPPQLLAIEPKKNISLPSKFGKKLLILAWTLGFLIIACAVSNLNGLCNPQFNFNNVSHDLKRRLYGQESAITDFNKFFKEKGNNASFDTIVLVGGIGVGKSYASEIIKSNLKDSVNVLDFFAPLYKDKYKKAYESLSVCRCNLIRLENLKTEDIIDAAKFIAKLKVQAEGYCILNLAMFNPEEIDSNLHRSLDLDRSASIINETFVQNGLHPAVIKLKSLNNEVLTKCIKEAAFYYNVDMSSADIEYVKRDLLSADSGCKGANAKVQVVGNKKVKSDL